MCLFWRDNEFYLTYLRVFKWLHSQRQGLKDEHNFQGKDGQDLEDKMKVAGDKEIRSKK